MKIVCPHCHKELAPSAVNIEKDTGYCESCRELFSLSALQEGREDRNEDAEILAKQPPLGVKVMRSGSETIVISRNSRLILLFLIPFTCLWSGGSMWGIYGTQIIKGKFELSQSLFGIPFLIGTIVLLSVIFFTLFSKIMMRLNDAGVTFDAHCFRVPSLPNEYDMTAAYSVTQPVQQPKKGLFAPKFFAWKDLRTVVLGSPRRQGTPAYMQARDTPSTFFMPYFPQARRDYMLAILRDTARRKGIRLKTETEW